MNRRALFMQARELNEYFNKLSFSPTAAAAAAEKDVFDMKTNEICITN